MTCSSSARYCAKRFLPSAVSRHSVCGRLPSWLFQISMSFASRNVSRWRLRLPSVMEVRRLSSLNSSPPGCVTSDVMKARRPFSCMERSSPSYAKRPSSDGGLSVFLGIRVRLPFDVEVQHDRARQLPYGENYRQG